MIPKAWELSKKNTSKETLFKGFRRLQHSVYPCKHTCSEYIFVTTHIKLFILGFGLLESGSVTTKNEVNIMVKNAADVIFGGLSYWAFGYALSFGEGK